MKNPSVNLMQLNQGYFGKGGSYWIKGMTFADRFFSIYGPDFPDLNGKSVLDIGCSDGKNTCSIAESYLGASITAIDIFDYRVKKGELLARSFGLTNVTFLNEDVCEAEFSSKFDVVLALNNLWYVVFQHKNFDECVLVDTVRAYTKHVAPGGLFLVSNHVAGMVYRRDEKGFTLDKICYDGDLVDAEFDNEPYKNKFDVVSYLMSNAT